MSSFTPLNQPEARVRLESEIKSSKLSRRDWYRNVYLCSDHWQELRGAKFMQCGKRCELCGSTERIQVHHLNYRSIYDVGLSDLQVVCHLCHQGIHEKDNPHHKPKPKPRDFRPGWNVVPTYVREMYLAFLEKSPPCGRSARRNWAVKMTLHKLELSKKDSLYEKLMAMKVGKRSRKNRWFKNRQKNRRST